MRFPAGQPPLSVPCARHAGSKHFCPPQPCFLFRTFLTVRGSTRRPWRAAPEAPRPRQSWGATPVAPSSARVFAMGSEQCQLGRCGFGKRSQGQRRHSGTHGQPPSERLAAAGLWKAASVSTSAFAFFVASRFSPPCVSILPLSALFVPADLWGNFSLICRSYPIFVTVTAED